MLKEKSKDEHGLMPIWRLDIRVTELSIKQLVMFELITRMKVILRIVKDFQGVFRCQVGSL